MLFFVYFLYICSLLVCLCTSLPITYMSNLNRINRQFFSKHIAFNCVVVRSYVWTMYIINRYTVCAAALLIYTYSLNFTDHLAYITCWWDGPLAAQDAKAEFTLSFSRAVQASERHWKGRLALFFFFVVDILKNSTGVRMTQQCRQLMSGCQTASQE